MNEMTALEYLKERARMVKYADGRCGIGCSECPLDLGISGKVGVYCEVLENERPKEAIAIVQKWAEEHPRKTILQDFLEKYPDAMLMDEDYPEICPHHLGYEEENCVEPFYNQCKECWNRLLEEVRKDDRKE